MKLYELYRIKNWDDVEDYIDSLLAIDDPSLKARLPYKFLRHRYDVLTGIIHKYIYRRGKEIYNANTHKKASRFYVMRVLHKVRKEFK